MDENEAEKSSHLEMRHLKVTEERKAEDKTQKR